MYFRVLEELGGRDHTLHHIGSREMVVHDVLLSSARASGSVADHEP
jgi:hypothetical protein